MKQKHLLWCGAILSVLAMFISLQSVQAPLYSGIAGGLCAAVSVFLFGFGLRADAQEKSALESKRAEEEQKQLEAQRQAQTELFEPVKSMFDALREEIRDAKESAEKERRARRERADALSDSLKGWFDAQQQSYAAAMNQFQTDITAVTEEIQALHKAIASESQSCSKAFAQLSKDIRACSESERMQTAESAKSICDSTLEQHKILRELLQTQGKESTDYYKFMVDQPWAELGSLAATLQSISDLADNILSAIESIQTDSEKRLDNALNRLKKDSESLQEKLQYVCKTLETQGQESRDTMDRIMQSYSNITAQDIEVLTALARETRV